MRSIVWYVTCAALLLPVVAPASTRPGTRGIIRPNWSPYMKDVDLITGLAIAFVQAASASPVVRSGFTTIGAGDPAFNTLIGGFRADLGGMLNPPGACSPTSCTSGRREVNWDAVPAGFNSPNPFHGDFFNGQNGVQPAGCQRGISLTTPGTGFRASAPQTWHPPVAATGEPSGSSSQMAASLLIRSSFQPTKCWLPLVCSG